MKNREEIILSMCYTYRKDYGLSRHADSPLGSGLFDSEREYIYNLMSKIFDRDIAPNMEFKRDTSERGS